MPVELRQRTQFPFSPTAGYNLSGPINFVGNTVTFGIPPGPVTTVVFSSNSITTFLPGATLNLDNSVNVAGSLIFSPVSILEGNPTIELSPQSGSFINFSGAGGITYASGTEEHFETGSELLMDAGSVAIFNNVPTFNDGLVLGPGESTLNEYLVGTFVPVPVGFTIVLAGGTVTWAGKYTQIGNFIHYQITATITGAATVAGTINVSNIPLPIAIINTEAAHLTDTTSFNYGHGVIYSKLFSPTFAATNGGGALYFSGEGFTS